LNPARIVDPQNSSDDSPESARADFPRQSSGEIVCPVCGAIAVQEKCKIICRSETCRGRVVMNCSEF